MGILAQGVDCCYSSCWRRGDRTSGNGASEHGRRRARPRMVALSFWVDVTSAAAHAWGSWAAAAGPNVTVHAFGSAGFGPAVAGDWAWRWVQLLAQLSDGPQGLADWFVVVPADAYVHTGALAERLACLDADEAHAFGRLSGRADAGIPSFGGLPVPVPALRAGLLLSRGLLAVPALRRLGAEVCSEEEVDFFAERSRRELGEGAGTPEEVEFSADDYAFAFCLAMARLPRPLANFASYLDHYILGRDALARLAFRATHGRRWPWRNLTRDAWPLEDAPACVIFVSPVRWQLADRWAELLWRRGCQARALRPYRVIHGVESGNTMFNVHDVEYSWWDGGLRYRAPYYPGEIADALEGCRAAHVVRPLPDSLPEPLPAQKTVQRRFGVGDAAVVFLLLGLPGGATSWGLQAMHEALRPLGAVEVKDLFHPFCHEAWRPEMALVLGAPEDSSSANLWRAPGRNDPLAQLARWVLGDAQVAVSKEVVNVARAAQFRRLGMWTFGLYRHRRHSFPLGDESSGTQEFCRSCFFRRMFESFMHQPTQVKALAHVKPLVEALTSSDIVRAVLLHTLTWYLLLKQEIPVIRYEVLVDGDHAEIAQEFVRALGGRLGRLRPDVWERADAFAQFVVSTRRPESLKEREARYAALHVEEKASALLQALGAADPTMDLQLLA